MYATSLRFNQFLSAATIGCLFFLALISFYKKNSIGYKFLAALFILIAFIFADDLLSDAGIYVFYPKLKVIFQPLLYAFPPFIFWVVSYLTSFNQKLTFRLLFHFIPYFLFLSLYLAEYISQTSESQIGILVKDSDNLPLDFFLLSVFFIQLAIYLFSSVRLLNRHKKTLPLFVSDIADNDFHWLFKTTIGLSIMGVLSFIEVLFDQTHIPFYYSFLYLFGFYYVGFQLIKQKDVFRFLPEEIDNLTDLIENSKKDTTYPESNELNASEANESEKIVKDIKKVINEEKMSYYKIRLLTLMDKEKPYLDPEITLPKLSRMLFLNTYQTSYLINKCFNENFYTFINRYRLETCKKMLVSNEYNHLSILGIAFEAGFNSKTAFNTTFKKSTGLSPKEYIKQIKKTNPKK